MQGSFGGFIFNVLNAAEEYPDFYAVASEGPTVVNNESYSPAVKKKGWHTVNQRGDRQRFIRTRTGELKTKFKPYPNKLDPEDVEG